MRRGPLAWVMLALMASELLDLYADLAWPGVAAAGFVIGLPIVGFRALRLREAYLLALCGGLLLLASFMDLQMAAVVREGLSRASFLAAFILSMALLREGAATSPSVEKVGGYLTGQPPGRRFLSVFAGCHCFAVLINLGALSLLAPIIQRGVRASVGAGQPLDEIAEVRERRQLSAALRGFSWFLLWAPTAFTQAVMPTLMSGIDTLRLMGTGFVLAVAMLGVAWLEDRLRWRRFRQRLASEGRLPTVSKAVFPVQAMRNLGTVCLGLFGLPLLFIHLFDVPIVAGVMLAAPIVAALWILAQHIDRIGAGGFGAAIGRLDRIAFDRIPGFIREAVFIGCAGFIGTLAAKLAPVDALASAIDLANQPGWLVLWGLTVSVWAFGQVGLSPITMTVFLGSLAAELPVLPVDITLAALAIAAGSAVCTAGAPFSSGAVLLSRVTGRSVFTLTWRWNGAYILVTLAILAGVYAALAR